MTLDLVCLVEISSSFPLLQHHLVNVLSHSQETNAGLKRQLERVATDVSHSVPRAQNYFCSSRAYDSPDIFGLKNTLIVLLCFQAKAGLIDPYALYWWAMYVQ